jgi:hypothetical protein
MRCLHCRVHPHAPERCAPSLLYLYLGCRHGLMDPSLAFAGLLSMKPASSKPQVKPQSDKWMMYLGKCLEYICFQE